MSDIVEDNKMENASPHGNGTEKSVSRESFRYQTIYNGAIDNLGRHLLGRILSFELINGKTVSGKMISFGQFDILILDSQTGQGIIVLKHAIAIVRGDMDPRTKKEMI